MFEDSLIESGNRLKTKRGWTSIVSFTIQIGIIGVMVLIPLIFTEALPKGQLMFLLVARPATASTSAASSRSGENREAGPERHRERRTAHADQDSKKVQKIKEDEAPPRMARLA